MWNIYIYIIHEVSVTVSVYAENSFFNHRTTKLVLCIHS